MRELKNIAGMDNKIDFECLSLTEENQFVLSRYQPVGITRVEH